MKAFLMHFNRNIMVVAVLLASSWLAHAVMPPFFEARAALERMESAEQYRSKATDVVTLRVEKVHSAVPRALGCPTWESWAVEGEIVQVLRGQLKPGATLKIDHAWEHYDCPGPVRESTPQIKPGMETEVFLICSGDGRCTLAAGAMSFISSKAFDAEMEQRKEDFRKLQRPVQPS